MACANINVEKSKKQKDSVLNYYQAMIQIRKDYSTLNTGEFALLNSADDIFVYRKIDTQGNFLIILNVSENENTFSHPFLASKTQKVVINNYPKELFIQQDTLFLKPYQAIVLQL